MKKILALSIAACLAAGSAMAAEAVKGEWTGYITDTHCAAKGANKDHTAGCVEKCMKGGSHAQILNEADGKLYDLAAFDAKVKPLVGKKVTLKGSLDKDSHTITVDTAVVATTH
jgi:opacity protein-like surface antigen